MPEHPVANPLLASTARWTASARALETTRPDALLHDPWAATLAGEDGQAWLAQRTPDAVLPMILRHRYFDDFLQRITRENAVRQVVLIAAGLDTRAYRLAWPEDTRLFELDQPQGLAYKAQVLETAGAQPACDRRAVPADLTASWTEALVQAGFDPQRPAAWLLEGFLFYLPNRHITSILDAVTSLASAGSWLGFDIINGVMLTHPLTKGWVDMQAAAGAPWIGTLDDPVGFLQARGWQASLSQAGQPDTNHGRWTLPVLPTLMPNVPHNWFVTAERS